MASQYWIKSGEKIKGPFTGKQLVHLASAGKVKPHFLVSANQKKWVRADHVKGLALPERVLPSQMSAPPVGPSPKVAQNKANTSSSIEVTEWRPKRDLSMRLELAQDGLTLSGGSMGDGVHVMRADIDTIIRGGPRAYSTRTYAGKHTFLVSEDDAGAVSAWLGKEYRETQLLRTSKRKALSSGLALLLVTVACAANALIRADKLVLENSMLDFVGSTAQVNVLLDPVVLLGSMGAVVYLVTAIILVISSKPWAVIVGGIVSVPVVLLNIGNVFQAFFAPAETLNVAGLPLTRPVAILAGLVTLVAISSVPLQGVLVVHSMGKWVVNPDHRPTLL